MKQMTNSMKWIAVGCLAAVGGCQTGTSTKPATQASSVRNDVTDIRPMETVTPTVYPPAPSQPVTYPAPTAQPAAYETLAAAGPVISTTPTSSGKHVVRRGETLYSIARQSYGNGKQWPKIASANPGVSPSSLKVGQTLTIP